MRGITVGQIRAYLRDESAAQVVVLMDEDPAGEGFSLERMVEDIRAKPERWAGGGPGVVEMAEALEALVRFTGGPLASPGQVEARERAEAILSEMRGPK